MRFRPAERETVVAERAQGARNKTDAHAMIRIGGTLAAITALFMICPFSI
jgi:hypothetical protein